MEYAFLDDTSLRFETFYLNRQLNNQDFNTGSRGQYISKFRNEDYIFRAGVNHLFGEENDLTPTIKEETDNKENEDVKEEIYSVHGLSTTAVQGYPQFNAQYSGAYSFIPQGQVRSGTSTDLFMGLRLGSSMVDSNGDKPLFSVVSPRRISLVSWIGKCATGGSSFWSKYWDCSDVSV